MDARLISALFIAIGIMVVNSDRKKRENRKKQELEEMRNKLNFDKPLQIVKPKHEIISTQTDGENEKNEEVEKKQSKKKKKE